MLRLTLPTVWRSVLTSVRAFLLGRTRVTGRDGTRDRSGSTRSVRVILAVAAFIIASGCKTTAVVIRPDPGFPGHTVDEVVHRLPTPDSLWTSFSGEMSIAYSMPDDRGTLNARFAARSDSVVLRFRLLGSELSRALITGDSIFVYDRVKRQLFYGDRNAAERMLPVAFRNSDVAASLFGYEHLDAADWSLSADSSSYRLTADDGRRVLTIDPGRWRVIASDERDDAGMIVEQRRYTDFERFGNLFLARRIVTNRPAEDMRASIAIRRIVPDPETISFDLGIRQSAERIPVY